MALSIPLVKKGNTWVFNTAQGKEEILDRRVGENELNAIQVMLAIVDAEREYAIKDRNRDGLLEYAQKLVSDPGKKNGLSGSKTRRAAEPPRSDHDARAERRVPGKTSHDAGALPWLLLQIVDGAGKERCRRCLQLFP